MTKTGTRSTAAAIVLGGLCIGLLSVRGMGQQQADPSAPPPQGAAGEALPMPFMGAMPPQTKLEAISSQRGVVLVKGYTDIGETRADDGSVMRVTAVEFTDAGKQAREQGVVVSIESRDEGGATRAIAYVDLEEIDALAAAVESLAKLDQTASALANVEGQYRTRGELELSSHMSNGSRVMSIRTTQVVMPSGQVLSAAATFRPARLAEFRQQVLAAKDLLGRPREEPAGR